MPRLDENQRLLATGMLQAGTRHADVSARFGVYRFVVLLMKAQQQLTVFQRDNARCHSAWVSMNFLQQQHIYVLPWPSKSPESLITEQFSRKLSAFSSKIR